MIHGMDEKRVPNPGDWTDAAGAGRLLGRARSTVYDMGSRGVLNPYEIVPGVTLYWVPEVREVAAALQRIEARR